MLSSLNHLHKYFFKTCRITASYVWIKKPVGRSSQSQRKEKLGKLLQRKLVYLKPEEKQSFKESVSVQFWMKHTQAKHLSGRKPHAAHNCYFQTEQEGIISRKRISLRLTASTAGHPQATQLHHPHFFLWEWRAGTQKKLQVQNLGTFYRLEHLDTTGACKSLFFL